MTIPKNAVAVPGYPMYRVTRSGEVWSEYTNKKLRPGVMSRGYLSVCVRNECGVRSELVHRLVAKTFISNPKRRPHVNHIDGDKQNNSWCNLEWATPRQNAHHAIDTGLVDGMGESNPRAKLTEEQVLEIRVRHAAGESQSSLSGVFGVAQRTISGIVRFELWPHLEAV